MEILLAPAADVRLFVDDRLIARENWSTTVPVAGSLIALRVLPTGGGGGKNVLRGVMMVAVLALAVYAPFAASGLMGANIGAFGGGLIAAGVGLGGMLAVNALIPPTTPSYSQSDTVNYNQNATITGARNSANLYGPIPVVFGELKIYPPLAAEPYVENIGSDSTLRMLFCAGQGEIEILEANCKIGETALTSYSDYEFSVGYADTIDDIYPDDVHIDGLSVEILEADGWCGSQTTPTGITEVAAEVTFVSGLWKQSDSGKIRSAEVVLEARYSVAGADSWNAFPESPMTVSKKSHAPLWGRLSGRRSGRQPIRCPSAAHHRRRPPRRHRQLDGRYLLYGPALDQIRTALHPHRLHPDCAENQRLRPAKRGHRSIFVYRQRPDSDLCHRRLDRQHRHPQPRLGLCRGLARRCQRQGRR